MFLHLKKSQNNAFIVLHGTPVTLHCHFYRKFSYQGDSSRFESLVGWGSRWLRKHHRGTPAFVTRAVMSNAVGSSVEVYVLLRKREPVE